MKNGKRVAIGARPPANPHDVTPALRARIKVEAFTRGLTVAEMLRVLLEHEFPEKQP